MHVFDKITTMQIDKNTLPTNVEALSNLVLELQQKLDQQSQFIEQLLEQMRLARHQHFGVRSERYSLDQLALVFNEAEVAAKQTAEDRYIDSIDKNTAADAIVVPAYLRKRGGRRPLPPELPRVDVIHTLDERACHCGTCRSELTVIGQKVSEQLDITPARVQVLRHIKKTYACDHCQSKPTTTPMPAQPIPKSMASPGTLAHIATAKYVDGLPLYRQEQQLKRIGVDLPRSTLAHWMVKAGHLVQPLINLLRDSLLGYDIIAMDETRLQVLKEPGRRPQSQSYLWVQRGGPPDHPIVLYDYDPSRSQQVPIRLLDTFAGYLQTDAYEGYSAVIHNNGITALGCWAHVRRKFDEAIKAQGNLSPEKSKATLAAEALRKIQGLYRIEREIKSLNDEQRQTVRVNRSVPLLDEFRVWLDQHIPIVPPRSALGMAMNYAHKQWPKLITYTQDGRLRMDNNLTENAIRPFVIGRNYVQRLIMRSARHPALWISHIPAVRVTVIPSLDFA
jgi:transposase